MSVTRKNLSQDKSLWTIRTDGVPVVLGSKNNFLNKTDSRLLQIVLVAWLFLICVVAPPPPLPSGVPYKVLYGKALLGGPPLILLYSS